MRRRLILAGGGHAHLFTLSRLSEFFGAGIDVVCIAPSPHLSYSGMGPGMLSGRYAPSELRFAIEAMVRGDVPGGPGRRPPTEKAAGESGCRPDALERGEGTFVQGCVCGIDAVGKTVRLADGREFGYDAVSCGIGSVVHAPFPVEAAPGLGVYPVKPIDNLLAARRDIASRIEAGCPPHVLVIGGGASAFEVAGNAVTLLAGCGVKTPLVTVIAGRGLLCDWPARARRLALTSLARRGVRIVPGRVERFAGNRALLAGGGAIGGEVCLLATGTRPPDLFARAGLSLAPDGGLAVNTFLQSPLFPEIFGGGDCIRFEPRPLARAGVYAVRQGPVLCANLLAFLTGGELTPFRRTGSAYLALLNDGDGRAILRKGPFVFEGRWCMALKDWIDRRFIRSFPPRRPAA